MIPYRIDVRTSIALCVMLSKISHLFTSKTNENENGYFSRGERFVIKHDL